MKKLLLYLAKKNKFSIIDLVEKFNINKGVLLHVGGNVGQELPVYQLLKFNKVIWVEGWPPFADELEEKIKGLDNHSLIRSMISDANTSVVNFSIASNKGSSTAFEVTNIWRNEFQNISIDSFHKIKCERLDDVLLKKNFDSQIDLMVLDIEGSELKALISLGDYINRINFALIEVSFRENFVDGPLFVDIDKFMANHGFNRVYLKAGAISGDALYKKMNKLNILDHIYMWITGNAVQLSSSLKITKVIVIVKNLVKRIINE